MEKEASSPGFWKCSGYLGIDLRKGKTEEWKGLKIGTRKGQAQWSVRMTETRRTSERGHDTGLISRRVEEPRHLYESRLFTSDLVRLTASVDSFSLSLGALRPR